MGGVCGANGNVSGTNGVCTPNGTDQDNLTTSDNGTQGVKPDGYSSNSGTFDWTKIAGGAVAFTAVATLIYMAKRYVNKLATPTVGQEGPTSKGPRDISKDDLYKKLETSTSGEVHFQGDTVSIDGEIYKVPDGFYQRYISQSLQGRAAANVPDNADSSRMAPPPDFGNSSDMGLVEKWNLVETDTCSLDTIEIAGRTFLVPNNLKGLIGSGMNGDNVYSTWADFDRAATAVQWSTSGDVTSTVFTALSSDSRMSTDGAIISGEVDESASWFKGASPTFNDGRSPLVDTNGELYDVAAPNYTATAMLDGQLVDIADYPDLEEGAVYETFPFEGGVAYEKVGMAYTAADLPGANNSAYEQFL